MADAKLTALTELSAPALGDWLYQVDVSDTTDDAAGSSRKLTNERLGGFLNPAVCNGRLTTESGVGVSTSDRTAQGTIYFTPWNGNRVGLYDGTRWKAYVFTEVSLALTATSGNNYDVFLYDNAGTLTLELSAAWTNATTRADALTTQDGISVKSGATTRRWLGTIRASGSNVTADAVVARYVWNAYNREPRNLYVFDGTSHTYTSSDVTRQWRATAGNKVEFVLGLAQDVAVSVSGNITTNAAATYGTLGPGLDATNAVTRNSLTGFFLGGTTGNIISTGALNIPVGLGYHYISLNQTAGSGTAATFDDGNLNVLIWM